MQVTARGKGLPAIYLQKQEALKNPEEKFNIIKSKSPILMMRHYFSSSGDWTH
jgi:hypothetical protein